MDFVSPTSRSIVEERIGRMHGISMPLVDETWRRSDGSDVEVEVAVAPMPWVSPRAAMVLVRDVTERRRLEAEREKLLAEKEMLMREVHHRVANSLQLVQGLLKLQARRTDSIALQHQLHEASARIGTIGTLHSRLQKEASTVEADARIYMDGVIADLRSALSQEDNRQIALQACQEGALTLKADLLVALGLIVAEAVTNSIKHGSGHITVRLEQAPAHLNLIVEDEGTGFPAGFDLAKDGRGLGMQMIASLVQTRGGTVRVGGGGHASNVRPSRIDVKTPIDAAHNKKAGPPDRLSA